MDFKLHSATPIVVALWSVLSAILPLSAIAQVPSVDGSLIVTVRDLSGAAVPSSSVAVTRLDQNRTREFRTDDRGNLTLPNLQPGEYEVRTWAENLAPQSIRIEILLGHRAAVSFDLVPAGRRDQITVEAPAVEPIDSSTIPIHTHVNRLAVASLPINQRSYLDFSLLESTIQRDTLRVHAVATTSGFNVMGQRPRNNSIQLDGADLNDETTGGTRGSVSMEAVQEFQVLVNGYQAEFGRASGGVVNAVTRSGTNEFHGSAFGFLRHRSLDATNAFSPVEDPPYTRTQYGASLGGPLERDRTFFFLSFEQLRRQESAFSRIGDSPATFDLTPAQKLLKASDPMHPAVLAAERGAAIAETGIDPATGGPPSYTTSALGGLSGVYPVGQRIGMYSARLDHWLTGAHRLSTRFNYTHDRLSSLEAQNNDQIAGLLSPGRTAANIAIDPTATLALSSTFSPNIVNELRFSWAGRQFEMTPNSLSTPVNIPGAAFIGGEPILPHIRAENHWHFQNTLSLSVGAHLLKFGGDVMLCPADVEYHRQINGMFNFGPVAAPGAGEDAPALTPVQAYGLGLPRQFVQQFGDPLADSGKTSAGLFAQDSWRATPRLTLDWGFRYDVETTGDLAPSNAALVGVFEQLRIRRRPPVDNNNFQPRAGFSYQLTSDARVSLRGSYGIYYDRLLNLSTYLATAGDGGQITRAILVGPRAMDVYRLPGQKLDEYPGGNPPTGLLAFSDAWDIGGVQQANLLISSAIRRDLSFDIGYVWVRGTHLPRSRDYNPPDPNNGFIRPTTTVSEVMAFEDSASSTYHGLRSNLRGRLTSALTLNASYTFSKAIDDAEEIFPHTRNQNQFDFRSDRGPALFDQRHRFVLSALFDTGNPFTGEAANAVFGNWIIAPIIEASAGRPVNVLLGFDNNQDGYPGSDRPDVVPYGTPGSVSTRYGTFLVPPSGVSGNLGRNAFNGPGFASFNLRLQKNINLAERLRLEAIAEAFNLLNRTNVRSVNPNFQRAGEPLTAHDPRQLQLGLRLRF